MDIHANAIANLMMRTANVKLSVQTNLQNGCFENLVAHIAENAVYQL